MPASSQILLFSEFAPGTVRQDKIKKLDTGGKIVWLAHGEAREPITLQTGMLRTPSGIRENKRFDDSSTSAPPKFSMELALDPADPEYAKLAEFDERMLTMAEEAKSNWVKLKYYDRNNLENVYSPALRIPRDKDTGEHVDTWPPTLRVNIPYRDGRFECPVYDVHQNELPIADFMERSRNAQVTVIVRCTGVWIAAGRFGTTWKAQQVLVHATKAPLGRFAFITTPEIKESMQDPSHREGWMTAQPGKAAADSSGCAVVPEEEEESAVVETDGSVEYLEDSE